MNNIKLQKVFETFKKLQETKTTFSVYEDPDTGERTSEPIEIEELSMTVSIASDEYVVMAVFPKHDQVLFIYVDGVTCIEEDGMDKEDYLFVSKEECDACIISNMQKED